MKFIKLPIKISKYSADEIEKYESMGLDYPTDMGEDSYLHVKPEGVLAYIEVSHDMIDLELTTGTRISVRTSIKEFERVLND